MDDFISPQSLATVSGCGFLVWLVVNGLRTFFGVTKRWLMLAVSAVVNAVLFVAAEQRAPGVVEALVLLGNTLVVAFAALGFQEATVRGVTSSKGGVQNAAEKVPWRSSWLA
jgi:hypothetical protein